jgi:tetratricopeptide (TPR) repeat protein
LGAYEISASTNEVHVLSVHRTQGNAAQISLIFRLVRLSRAFSKFRATVMTIDRSIRIILIAAIAVVSVGGIGTLATLRAVAPNPNLDRVRALARAHEFTRAQALLEDYLRVSPSNDRAHVLMAQLTTEPNNSHPEKALLNLQAVRPHGPKHAALLKFLAGKARYQQGRFDLAEECWAAAVRLDPMVPEAGWVLVDLLDKEGRVEEAHNLGMRLHAVEPDPRDRVRILLEMSRLDIETPDPLSQVELFEPLVKAHRTHLPLALTLGRALTRVNRAEEGLEVLNGALCRNPDSPEVWDAWLSGLYQASEVDKLADEYARLPSGMASDARFAKHEGMIAQTSQDWPRAVRAYRRAFAFEPSNWGICYRLLFVLRQAGETALFERMNRIYEDYKLAYEQMRGSYFERFEPKEASSFRADDCTQQRGAYYELITIKTLGIEPRPELYQRMANLREKMGRPDEARAWHRLVLRDLPDNAQSLAALECLK